MRCRAGRSPGGAGRRGGGSVRTGCRSSCARFGFGAAFWLEDWRAGGLWGERRGPAGAGPGVWLPRGGAPVDLAQATGAPPSGGTAVDHVLQPHNRNAPAPQPAFAAVGLGLCLWGWKGLAGPAQGAPVEVSPPRNRDAPAPKSRLISCVFCVFLRSCYHAPIATPRRRRRGLRAARPLSAPARRRPLRCARSPPSGPDGPGRAAAFLSRGRMCAGKGDRRGRVPVLDVPHATGTPPRRSWLGLQWVWVLCLGV
jgi:hypothetical protein